MFLDPEKALSVFSSKGNLTQCDNALRAASNSALAVGCSTPDGCVLMSFKNVPPLVDKERYHKVFMVCPTIGVTYAGLQPDFRAQLTIAQDICQDYFDVFGRYPSLETFMAEFSLDVQETSQRGGLRPFGVLLIFCGQGRTGPMCYQLDPSGSFTIVKTAAAGVGHANARSFLESRPGSPDDMIPTALHAIIESAGRELAPNDVSIGVLRNGLFSIYDEEGVREVFDSIKR